MVSKSASVAFALHFSRFVLACSVSFGSLSLAGLVGDSACFAARSSRTSSQWFAGFRVLALVACFSVPWLRYAAFVALIACPRERLHLSESLPRPVEQAFDALACEFAAVVRLASIVGLPSHPEHGAPLHT